MFRGNKAGKSVAHNWAHQLQSKFKKDTGEGSHFYYEGKTIYSYGRHFPIAVMGFKDRKKNKDINSLIEGVNDKDLVVFFTLRTYSNTTSGHKSAVSSACSHLDIIYCKNPDEAFFNNHDNNLLYWENRAKEQAENIAKAKKPEKYFDAIASHREEAKKYAEYFKIKLTAKKFPNLFLQADEKTLEAIKDRHKKAEQAKEKLFAEELNRFRTFTNIKGEHSDNMMSVSNPKDRNAAYLRYNKKTKRIETTKNIQIPVELGKRFYNWLKTTIKKGGCVDGNCKQEILGYSLEYVNANEFKVGCHTVQITEADLIAKQLKW